MVMKNKEMYTVDEVFEMMGVYGKFCEAHGKDLVYSKISDGVGARRSRQEMISLSRDCLKSISPSLIRSLFNLEGRSLDESSLDDRSLLENV